MKKHFLAIALLIFSINAIVGYHVGYIDTINNNGTGFGAGSPAQGYQTGSSAIINGTAVQPDGKIVAVGQLVGEFNYAIVYRYDIDGLVDTSFNNTGNRILFFGTSAEAKVVQVLPSGIIVVAGGYNNSQFFITEILPDGSGLNTSFGSSGSIIGNVIEGSTDIINAINIDHVGGIDAVGDIYVTGVSMQPEVNDSIFIAKYNSGGTLQTEYNNSAQVAGGGYATTQRGFAMISIAGTDLIANTATFDSQLNIIVGGFTNTTTTNMFLAKFTPAGIVNTTFNASGYTIANPYESINATVYGIGIQSSGDNAGKIVVAGTYGSGENTGVIVGRFTTNGAVDTTFGLSFTPGFVTNGFGSKSAACGLVIRPNDTIVVGGFALFEGVQSFLLACFLSDGSDTDSSFGTSYGSTLTNVAAPNVGTALTIQQNGSFILAGSTSGDNFAVLRYLGDQYIAGAPDYYYPTITSGTNIPSYKTYPEFVASSNKPVVMSVATTPNNEVIVASQLLATSESSYITLLNADGSFAASTTSSLPSGIQQVVVDSSGRFLVVGGNSDGGWMMRYVNVEGTLLLDTTFNNGSFVYLPTATIFYRVGILTTDDIYVIGQDENAANSSMWVYSTSGEQQSGILGVNDTIFTDLIIDQNNIRYVAAINVAIGQISIVSNNVDFGSAGNCFVGINPTDYNGNPCLAFDVDGNIVIAVSSSISGNIVFKKFNTSGQQVGSTFVQTQSMRGLTLRVVSMIQCNSNNQILFAGEDSNVFFIGRLSADFSRLDTTFAPYAFRPGIISTKYNDENPTQVLYSFCIAPNGSIIFGGYEDIDASNTVNLVGQVIGDADVNQVARFPFFTTPVVGSIDTSFGSGGAYAIPGGQSFAPQSIACLSSGDVIVGICYNSSEFVGLSNPTATGFSLNDPFGSGESTPGVTQSLGTLVNIRSVISDVAGNLYGVGNNNNGYYDPVTSVVTKLPANGSDITWTASANVTNGNAIAQQSSGRILMAGYDSNYNEGAGSGVIVAYNPNTGAIDTSFNQTGANPGYYYTNESTQITSLSVGTGDYADLIYASYMLSDNSVGILSLLANGSSENIAWNYVDEGTRISNVAYAMQIKMKIDTNGNIVVIANTESGFAASCYYSDGSDNVVNVAISVDNPISAQLLDMMCLDDGTTLFLGSNTTPAGTMIVGRLTSEFTVDTTFGVNGLLQTTVTSPVTMTNFYALGMQSVAPYDILITGDDTINPYIIAVASGLSSQVSAVSQTTNQVGASGTLDTTCNVMGTNPGFINLSLELPNNFPTTTSSQALLQMSNGSYFIAISDDSNTYIKQFSPDDVENQSFGITLEGLLNVSAMMLTQDNNLCIVGGSGAEGSGAGWIVICSMAGDIIAQSTTGLDVHYAVGQQSNGSIIVAGQKQRLPGEAGIGAMIAYNSVTGSIDQSFGAAGYFYITGQDYVNPTVINSILIMPDDGICYFNYQPSTNPITSYVLKASADGTNGNTWQYPQGIFGTPNQESTYLTAAVDGSVILVTVLNNSIFMQALDSETGQYYWTAIFNYNASPSFAIPTEQPRVTGCISDADGNYVITFYDRARAFIMKVLNSIQDGLDTSFNAAGTIPGVQNYYGADVILNSNGAHWNDLMINANGKITLLGFEYIDSLATPYLMRLYGTEFVGQYTSAVAAGNPGTLDPSYGTNGTIDLSGIDASLTTLIPQVVLPIANGYQYIAFTNGTLIRITNNNQLDTTFGDQGFAGSCPAGVSAMILDGNNQLVLVGTNTASPYNAWIVRYNNDDTGTLDTNFAISGMATMDYPVTFNALIQQSMGRYVIGGKALTEQGALFAYNTNGLIDTTFNANQIGGSNPGIFLTGIENSMYTIVSDAYDRILYAVQNGSAITLARITSSASHYDTTFNGNGIIYNALVSIDNAQQVRLVLDAAGNIIIAGHYSAGSLRSIVAEGYNASGSALYNTTCISVSSDDVILTDMMATSNGNVILAGYTTEALQQMFMVNLTSDGSYNSAFGDNGIFETTFGDNSSTARILSAIALYPDGEISMIGHIGVAPSSSFLARVYYYPYETEVALSLYQKSQGIVDATFGAGQSPNYVQTGIAFFGSTDGINQVARAVAPQDGNDSNLIVALDGNAGSIESSSSIYINSFDVDGVLNPSFNSQASGNLQPGQALVLNMFDNQYVNDMITFTTASGVSKAILAGYATNTALSATGSLIMQYNLQDAYLDTTFGGFNNNSLGVAFGDGKQMNTIRLQSTGRIIAAGSDQSDMGMILAYTPTGNLDQSFGQQGVFLQGQSSIYGTLIDAHDRVIVAYNDLTLGEGSGYLQVVRILADGSGIDTSFGDNGYATSVTTVHNNNFAIALDLEQNIVVMAGIYPTTIGSNLTIFRYDQNGGFIGVPQVLLIGSEVMTISKLLVDQNNSVVCIGYADIAGQKIVIARFVYGEGYIFDPTFNNGTYMTYAVGQGNGQYPINACIHPDGRIVIAGYHNNSL